MKYHTSSCYRQFQRDMETEGYRAKSITHPLEQSQSSQQETSNNTSERCSKRFKSSVTKNVSIICGADIKTVQQKKIHTLYRICEKPMAQKLLNAGMLFKDHIYTETAAMTSVDDVFAADVMYHNH